MKKLIADYRRNRSSNESLPGFFSFFLSIYLLIFFYLSFIDCISWQFQILLLSIFLSISAYRAIIETINQ